MPLLHIPSGSGSLGSTPQTTPSAPSQMLVPVTMHAPTPSVQGSPKPVPSSVSPLQSSSMPLQTSGRGSLGSAPQTVPPDPSQMFVPETSHAPTPAVQGCPRPRQ